MQIIRQMESLFRAGSSAGLGDGPLLERFVHGGEEAEAAFAAMVERHGPMVLRVCRQVLGNEEDARDASQATFLVLARRAGSIGRRESVGSWLYGVALRVANKARVAAARRRAHERRGGEMAACRVADERSNPEENRELGTIIHEELGRLPDVFRAPLVLCYLEGLTQEQAAARLRAPLGTIQSRLARGRARIKEGLERRGLDALASLAGASLAGGPPPPIPPSWAEATIRMAMPFGRGDALGSTAAGLAEEVVRSIVIGRIRAGAPMILVALVLVCGAVAWAAQRGGKELPPQLGVRKVPIVPPADPPPRPEMVERTFHGIVRDETGRPVARAWIGMEVRPLADDWRVITAPDQLREAREPYRDAQGNRIPPGALGKYSEYRDDSGNWRAVHPGDIRRHDPSRSDPFSPRFSPELDEAPQAPADGFLEIRVAKGRWQMFPLWFGGRPADRTDSEGRFSVDVRFLGSLPPVRELHFASPDFRKEAIRVVRRDGTDRPIEVTLKPIRLVRARVIETPRDHPEIALNCRFYSTDLPSGEGRHIEAIRSEGAFWGYAIEREPFPDDSGPAGSPRWVEARLVPGRYKADIDSSTFYWAGDLNIPAGDGPLDLPDIRPETLKWVRTLGQPADEIEAVDLDGKPVRLADYRGQVVVLLLWNKQDVGWGARLDWLVELHRRLAGRPLALLAMHDASLTSVEAFRQCMAPILDKKENPAGPPFRLLLDLPPEIDAADPLIPRAGERGSGRTRNTYAVPPSATMVIDQIGRLSFIVIAEDVGFHRFEIGKDGTLDHEYQPDAGWDVPQPKYDARGFAFHSLLRAVEGSLGLPLTPMPEAATEPVKIPPRPRPSGRRSVPEGPRRITGTVVGLAGKPIAGATVSPHGLKSGEKAAKSDAAGAFTLVVEGSHRSSILKVEAPGMATRTFATELRNEGDALPEREGRWIIEPDGRIPKPLRMGPGAIVTGRVVRDGRPVPNLTMVLKRRGSDREEGAGAYADFVLGNLEVATNERGLFRFERIAAGEHQRYSVYARAHRRGDLQVLTPRVFKAGPDGQTIDLGDVEVRPGRTLAGRVIFSDRPSPPPGAAISVNPEWSDWRFEPLDEAGRFAIHGIPDDRVDVSLILTREGEVQSIDGLPGYHLSRKNRCHDPRIPYQLRGRLDRDIKDLTILVEPGDPLSPVGLSGIDPAELADFRDAEAGPITGVPAGARP